MKHKTGYFLLLAVTVILLALALLLFNGSNLFAAKMQGTVYIDEILASNHSFPNADGI